tara:strand:+ start:141 stop:308 length:168 start_codon:yes stop_codon:yes gene_type:complete
MDIQVEDRIRQLMIKVLAVAVVPVALVEIMVDQTEPQQDMVVWEFNFQQHLEIQI